MNRNVRSQNQSFSMFLPDAENYQTDNNNSPKATREEMNLFSLEDVTKELNFEYVTYNGSLTTPECNILSVNM